MFIKPGEHAHLAQLLRFMELGEQLAHDCAQTQCALAPERGMQTFLAGQARQEGYHACTATYRKSFVILITRNSWEPGLFSHPTMLGPFVLQYAL